MKEKCEHCKKTCLNGTLLKHISHARNCKVFYGDRYIQMLGEKRKIVQSKSHKKHKIKRNEVRRIKPTKSKYDSTENNLPTKESNFRIPEIISRIIENDNMPSTSTESNLSVTETNLPINTSIPVDENNLPLDNLQNSTIAKSTLEEQTNICKECKGTFDPKKLLYHISRSDKCKMAYGGEESVRNMLGAKKKSYNDFYRRKNNEEWIEAFHEEFPDFDENDPCNKGYLLKCIGCNIQFTEDRFYRHVSHSKDCKKAFGEKKWKQIKNERRKFQNFKNKKNHKKKYSKKKKEYYAKKKTEKKEASKKQYLEMKEKLKLEIPKLWKCMEKKARDRNKREKEVSDELINEDFETLKDKVSKKIVLEKLKEFEVDFIRETSAYYSEIEKIIDQVVIDQPNELKDASYHAHEKYLDSKLHESSSSLFVGWRNLREKWQNKLEKMANDFRIEYVCHSCTLMRDPCGRCIRNGKTRNLYRK